MTGIPDKDLLAGAKMRSPKYTEKYALVNIFTLKKGAGLEKWHISYEHLCAILRTGA